MNAVGQIGNFIIEYQDPIEIGLLVMAAIILICVMIKLIIDSKKKRSVLSEISQTVAEINTAVGALSDKRPEVIYIDNRVPKGISGLEFAEKQAESKQPGVPEEESKQFAMPETEPEQSDLPVEEPEQSDLPVEESEQSDVPDDESKQDNARAAEEAEQRDDKTPPAHQEIPKRFFSRECAVDKNGKTYTIEELNNQIKE